MAQCPKQKAEDPQEKKEISQKIIQYGGRVYSLIHEVPEDDAGIFIN